MHLTEKEFYTYQYLYIYSCMLYRFANKQYYLAIITKTNKPENIRPSIITVWMPCTATSYYDMHYLAVDSNHFMYAINNITLPNCGPLQYLILD